MIIKIPWYKVKGTDVAMITAIINPSVPYVMTMRFRVPQSKECNLLMPVSVT